MYFDEYLKCNKTLNIFCDASTLTVDTVTYGCPAVITVQGLSTILDKSHQILQNTTNNRSEYMAMFMALQIANHNKSTYSNINIFSDSKITVYGLSYWIHSWINNMDEDYIFYSNAKKKVLNQDLLSNLVYYIIKNNLKINLFHQKGHVTSTEKSISHAIDVFYDSNKIVCEKDTIILLSKFNNIVDEYSGNELSVRYHRQQNPSVPLFSRIMEPSYRDQLNALINTKNNDFKN